ncbi:MAG: tRNA pseudouridine(55) synthase TruB [Bacteroidota bacterium]
MTVLSRERRLSEGEVLLLDKPKGWTSFDVVNKIRRLFRVKKVGHAGTLDPLATGLLLVCTGRKTKEMQEFVGLEKEYEAEMIIGARTASYDAATPVLETRPIEGITAGLVRETLAGFVGTQKQIPPMYSAARVDGRRLYALARKGREVERRPREIVIRSITPTVVDLPVVRFTVVCSKGTYIRALVHDIGERLGCGAYLTALRRTRIGNYRLEDAVTIDDLIAHQDRYREMPS